MTTKELARLLANGPDLPLLIDDREIKQVSLETIQRDLDGKNPAVILWTNEMAEDDE